MKRAASSLLVVILLVAPGVALGKVPWSTVEIMPAAPVAGEPLTVVVRFWDDSAHTEASSWRPDGAHGASLQFQGAAGSLPVTLTRTGDGAFRGEVALAAGTWRLMAVQEYLATSGPTGVELATVTVGPAPSAAAPIGAAIIGVALAMVGLIWRGRRSPSLIEPR